MKLFEMTVEQYIDAVASDAPAPGGGSASALAGAQGAALVAMVAGLTVGREKYAERWDECASIREKVLAITSALGQQIDRDTEAFNLVSAAYKLPRESDCEKLERKRAIAEATVCATEEPLETMRLSREALSLAERLSRGFNTTAASDLGVAALNLKAACDGAHYNVLINLSGLGDEDAAAAYRAKAEEISAEASALFDAVRREALSSI